MLNYTEIATSVLSLNLFRSMSVYRHRAKLALCRIIPASVRRLTKIAIEKKRKKTNKRKEKSEWKLLIESHRWNTLPLSILPESIYAEGPPGESRQAAHGWVTAQVPVLHQIVHAEGTFDKSRASTHRRIATPMSLLLQVIHSQGAFDESCANPHRRIAAQVWILSEDLHQEGTPQ